MAENIRKAINTPKTGEEDCKSLLESEGSVSEFADFWEKHGDDLATIAARKLLDFVSGSYSSDEIDAYKKAQKDLSVFFIDCWKERDMRRKKIEEEFEKAHSDKLSDEPQ